MSSSRQLLLSSSIIAGLAAASLAAAQPAAPPPQNQTPAKPTSGQSPAEADIQQNEQAASSTTVGELVITGSHIKRTEFTSPSPIQVVTSEISTLEGVVDTGTLLQQQPIASGSFQVNGQLTGFVVNGGPGASTLSLRGLGPQRTLVLLDGKRIGPAGVRGQIGAVDLNVIPDSILDRTEILKDGASSTYGSDAVAGVVNFITKTNLDGGQLSVYGNIPQRSGGGQVEVNGAWGKTFDRGYFNVSGDYSEQKELRLGQRKLTACAEDFVFDPTTRARLDFTDPLTGRTKCYNLFTNVVIDADGEFGGVLQYAVPGITYPTAAQGNNIHTIAPLLEAMGFVRAGRAGQIATQPYLNEDNPLYARGSAISPYKRYTAYAAAGYDLTPTTQLYANILLNRRDSVQHGFQQFFATVAAGNPNNPIVYVDGPHDALPVVAQRLDQSQRVDFGRAVVGLKGKFGAGMDFLSNWDWELYGEFSHSKAAYTTTFAFADRVAATTGFGSPLACDPSQITLSGPVTCMPIPYFSPHFLAGQFTPQEAAFLFGEATGHTEYDQELVEGTVSGDLLQAPAGPVSVALGATYRRDHIDDTPSGQEQAGNFFNLSAAQITRGTDYNYELFGELNIPLIKGVPLFEKLDFEGSARYTHDKSYGGNGTYKLGLNWQVMPSIRLRGTYGTSFRAPALYELFLGDQTGFLNQNQIDPCLHPENLNPGPLQTNCFAAGVPVGFAGGGSSALILTGGGAGRLRAETSKAATVGLILTPSWINLSVAIDYFDIRVKNEVARFGAFSILNQCYGSTNFPNDPFCSLFVRDPVSHSVTLVHDNYLNVVSEINRGLDLTVRYTHDFSFGKLAVDTQVTWQFEDTTQLLGASTPQDFNGSTTEPDFTAQSQIRFDHGDWTFFWKIDAIGKASDTEIKTTPFFGTDVHLVTRYAQGAAIPVYFKQYTELTIYHSLSVRLKMDKWTFEGGVQNLFDEPPPVLSGDGIENFRAGMAALNAYDLVGRKFFFQIDRKF